MKFFTSILAIATIASAASTPKMERRTAVVEKRASALCGPLDTPMCCGTDILGLADLSCSSVPNTVTTTDDFTAYCSSGGKTAECCVTSLLGSLGVACGAA
ncbi:hypothetical protein E4T47_07829 [Aureobasidium subglaciale]|nr:hypothetical protein E4T43_08162 [Aureobasidium subglaciale]KAI5268200.1 hypothetical protein E4T47_07829 [Aureobasidium subglaciale]